MDLVRVLITGGAGFVGSNLADYLLRNSDADVVIYDNMSRQGVENNVEWLKSRYSKSGRLQVVKADIRDYARLVKAAKDVNVIYHTAAQVAVTTSLADPFTDFEVNARGTLNVLEAARKLRTEPIIVLTSTNKVFGDLVRVAVEEEKTRYDFKNMKAGVDEKIPLDPISPYGCSKCTADEYVLDYYRTYGLKTVVFRMSCIYGPRQFGTEDQGWICFFAVSALLGRLITIYGDGKQVRDVLFIDDLARAFDLAVKNIGKAKGNAYNIGGGSKNTFSLLELIEYLKLLTGKEIKFTFDKWRPGDQRVYYTDIRRAKKELGWSPQVDKRDGVKKLLTWAQDNMAFFRYFYR